MNVWVGQNNFEPENDVKKKNKDIEVRIEEVKKDIKGKNYEVTQLFIGKK
ncbi:hypothetical protein EfmAA242_22310 [Enterococcus faecium]|nr:hypothetical protein EfmAA242_22310 [Enterococcus faecium]